MVDLDDETTKWRERAVAPREDLDTELKRWLDPRNELDRANLAHAMSRQTIETQLARMLERTGGA